MKYLKNNKYHRETTQKSSKYYHKSQFKNITEMKNQDDLLQKSSKNFPHSGK